jgi:hypothetical protein
MWCFTQRLICAWVQQKYNALTPPIISVNEKSLRLNGAFLTKHQAFLKNDNPASHHQDYHFHPFVIYVRFYA